MNFVYPRKMKKLSLKEGSNHTDSFAIAALLNPPDRAGGQGQFRKTAFS